MRELANSFLVAAQFLTRLPVVPINEFSPDGLAKSAVFFPIVGLIVGAGGVLLHWILSQRVDRSAVIVVILIYLAAVTGGLHEDGLMDAADGFGGGWGRERILEIMHDSRIGSFGAIAITLALLAKFVFLTDLPFQNFTGYFLAGQVLSRWTTLPLAFFMRPARAGGEQGTRIAKEICPKALVLGTGVAIGIVVFFLKWRAVLVLGVAIGVAALTGLYYNRRIGGVTGDCLGATNQITEVAIYFAGVVLR